MFLHTVMEGSVCMTVRSVGHFKRFAAALALCLLGFSAFSAYVEDGRGIISQPVLYFSDGTIIEGANGNDSLTDIDGDGLYEVLPGDIITLTNGSSYVVGELPGYPDGTPYEFDPTVPAIIGGSPLVIVDLDGNLIPDTPISFPGYDGSDGNDDDILVDPHDPAVFFDIGNGYVVVTNNGAVIEHRDGTPLEGGDAPAGSVIASPNIVVRPGTGTELPADHINPDGTIHLVAGNTVDLDGDGKEPWTVPEPGVYDPVTGLFTPDNDPENPYPVPPPDSDGVDAEPVIESIALDDTHIYLEWPNYLSSGVHRSRIWAKAFLDSPPDWVVLENGNPAGVTITETNAVIPRTLVAPPYRFFKREVPGHVHPAP
jgi:hypothetical protein